MVIKNIFGSPILFENLGYEIQPDESIYIYELGDREFIKKGSKDIVDAYLNNKIELQYNDTQKITDFPTILSILNGDVADVNITSVASDSDIINVSVDSKDSRSDDYYYFSREISLVANQAYTITFKGYMKTFAIRTQEADLVAYITNPRMSGFHIDAFSETHVELDYQKKDLSLRIFAKKPSVFELFCDGVYYSEDGKTKNQYIKELESKGNISEEIPEEIKGLIFDLDLQKDFEKGTKVISDSALGQGVTIYNESDEFHNSRYIPKDMYFTCGNILTMQYGAEHTLTTWIKFSNNDNCYVIDNYEQFYIKLYHGRIYTSVRNKTVSITDNIITEQWYMVAFTADDNQVDIFLNGSYVTTIASKRVKPKTTAFYIGMRHNGTQKFDGELGKIRMYNYKLSAGMIAYVAQNENPTVQDIFLDSYENGLLCSFYDIHNYKQKYPNDHYEYTVLEKEFAKPANLLSSSKIYEIDHTKASIPQDDYYLTVITGVLKIYESGHYVFAIDGGDAIEFLIDDAEIIGWYDMHDRDNSTDHQKKVYLDAGEYNIKFRHQEITGTSSFYLYWMKPGDTEFEIVPNYNLYTKKEENAWSGFLSIVDSVTNNNIETSQYYMPMVLGDTPNRYFKFTGKNDYFAINNLPQTIYSNVLRVSFWFHNQGEYAIIFCSGGGDAWDHHLSAYVSSDKLHLSLYGKESSTKSRIFRGWHKVDILIDGVKCRTYIDGEIDNHLELDYERDTYFEVDNPRVVFNRLGDLSNPRWMDGEYRLGDFVMTTDLLSQKDIEHNFNNEEKRYR